MRNKTIIIIGAILMVGLMITQQKDWKENYEKEIIDNNLQEFIKSNEFYNYDDAEIKKITSEIERKSKNEKDIIKHSLDYVEKNVEYNKNYQCGIRTSSLLQKEGQCVTMTQLAITLLRGNGIAARPVGGCLKKNIGLGCFPLLSVEPSVFKFPKHPEEEKIVDNIRRGWLHQWLQVWIPGKGWTNADATSGQVYNDECDIFIISDYTLTCNEKNKEFILLCEES